MIDIDKKITYVNLNKKEIEMLKKQFKNVEVKEITINEVTQNKNIKIKKLLEQLKYNEKLEANKNLCSMLKIQTRTLNRYIKELINKGIIKGEVKTFKDGGRGYIIESVISKEKNSKSKTRNNRV